MTEAEILNKALETAEKALFGERETYWAVSPCSYYGFDHGSFNEDTKEELTAALERWAENQDLFQEGVEWIRISELMETGYDPIEIGHDYVEVYFGDFGE